MCFIAWVNSSFRIFPLSLTEMFGVSQNSAFLLPGAFTWTCGRGPSVGQIKNSYPSTFFTGNKGGDILNIAISESKGAEVPPVRSSNV